MMASLIYFKGEKNGRVAALGCLIATMAKHIVVDGLIPPPPVMVMTALTLVAQFAAPGEWGKRAFVGFMMINLFTFTTNPDMVLSDSYADIASDAVALDIGRRFMEVICERDMLERYVLCHLAAPIGLRDEPLRRARRRVRRAGALRAVLPRGAHRRTH